MVRGQYAKNRKTRRRNMRCRSVADLHGLLEYFTNTDHPNHDEVRILGCKTWRTSLDEFVPAVESARKAYLATADHKAGAKWSRDIAEHLIAAPDKGSDLSDAEVQRIATRILAQISPRSPAVWAAHFKEETKTWEIHFAISSFTDEPKPQLRVTDLRRREAADYAMLLDEAGFVALQETNQARVLDCLPAVRMLSDLHTAKLTSVADVLCRTEVPSRINDLSISELLACFEGTSWRVQKHTKTSVSLVSDDFSTPLHVRWADLTHAVLGRTKAKTTRREPKVGLDARSHEPDL